MKRQNLLVDHFASNFRTKANHSGRNWRREIVPNHTAVVGHNGG